MIVVVSNFLFLDKEKSPHKPHNIELDHHSEESEENEESETENTNELQLLDPRSEYNSGYEEKDRKYSHYSNINMDSVIQEKDFSINRLQHELYNRDKSSQKWKKRFTKLKRLYKRKCLELEEALAYLDIEGEQNKILEQKTIELQSRVENEIKQIKSECEEIILERENDHKEEVSLLHETIRDRDEQIEQYKKAYNDLEDETTVIIKNFRTQILSKESEFEALQEQLVKTEDDQLAKKMAKIAELERKITTIKHRHNEEIDHLKEQIEKYQNMLREKDMELEGKLLDANSNYRKKETNARTDYFKLKKDLEVSIYSHLYSSVLVYLRKK